MKCLRCGALAVLAACLVFASTAYSQVKTEWRVNSDERHSINIPDIPGYTTLKCDLHMHTVFSDGSVWPTVRVDEAWREGLDAIAITDHIEYQPKKSDIPTNHNRPYEIATTDAQRKNILLPRSGEITRDTPPGHFNALFLEDVDPLDTEDLEDAAKAASEQGGFVFWNHPGWKGTELGKWRDIHTTLYENKWLHGIEVCNGNTYYPEAHQWALEKNLTIVGNTDIHGPSLDRPRTPESHRTLTLAFAKERTVSALKEALVKGRTAVWCKNQVYGRGEYLDALFHACIDIGKPYHTEKETHWFAIRNTSDIDLELERTGEHGPREVTLPANATLQVRVKVEGDSDHVALAYAVKNFVVAPEESLKVTLNVALE